MVKAAKKRWVKVRKQAKMVTRKFRCHYPAREHRLYSAITAGFIHNPTISGCNSIGRRTAFFARCHLILRWLLDRCYKVGLANLRIVLRKHGHNNLSVTLSEAPLRT